MRTLNREETLNRRVLRAIACVKRGKFDGIFQKEVRELYHFATPGSGTCHTFAFFGTFYISNNAVCYTPPFFLLWVIDDGFLPSMHQLGVLPPCFLLRFSTQMFDREANKVCTISMHIDGCLLVIFHSGYFDY